MMMMMIKQENLQICYPKLELQRDCGHSHKLVYSSSAHHSRLTTGMYVSVPELFASALDQWNNCASVVHLCSGSVRRKYFEQPYAGTVWCNLASIGHSHHLQFICCCNGLFIHYSAQYDGLT